MVDSTVRATWQRDAGWLDALSDRGRCLRTRAEFALDVVVNETAPGRERRRGQLVLCGAAGEFVYLRGDRHDPRVFSASRIPDD